MLFLSQFEVTPHSVALRWASDGVPKLVISSQSHVYFGRTYLSTARWGALLSHRPPCQDAPVDVYNRGWEHCVLVPTPSATLRCLFYGDLWTTWNTSSHSKLERTCPCREVHRLIRLCTQTQRCSPRPLSILHCANLMQYCKAVGQTGPWHEILPAIKE